MSVPSKDLYLRQGNSRALTFGFKFRDEAGEVQDRDLTGVEVIFKATTSGSPIIASTADSGPLEMISATEAPQLKLSYSAAMTRQHRVGRFNKWEMEFHYPSGDEITKLQGYVVLTEGNNIDAD